MPPFLLVTLSSMVMRDWTAQTQSYTAKKFQEKELRGLSPNFPFMCL